MLAQGVFTNFSKISAQVFKKYDEAVIQRRSRVRRNIDAEYICQFTFKLMTKVPGGFGVVAQELSETLNYKDIPSYAASSICEARKKFPADLFLDLNRELLGQVENGLGSDELIEGQGSRKIFAVDGSKMFVPRGLKKFGFKTEIKECHYPTARISCLFEVGAGLIHDISLNAHGDERKAALTHFAKIKPEDIVIYDRGYFGFKLIAKHAAHKSDFIMRVGDKVGVKEIDQFIEKNQNKKTADSTVTIQPKCHKVQKKLEKSFPGQTLCFALRIVKYTHENTSYYVLTSLKDQPSFSVQRLSDLYHARWGVEEIYKQIKVFTLGRTFHGICQRTVRQELYASALLLNIGRILALETENEKKMRLSRKDGKLIKDMLLSSRFPLQ